MALHVWPPLHVLVLVVQISLIQGGGRIMQNMYLSSALNFTPGPNPNEDPS
jgi:hypothetical protein